MDIERKRIVYFIIIITVILLGLGSRSSTGFFSPFVAAYAGDVLWGLMIFLVIGFVFNHKATFWVWWGAMIFSCAIEFSQLYQAPWINSIRHTMIGGLILGYGFLWSDLICYTIGIVAGVMTKKLIFRKL